MTTIIRSSSPIAHLTEAAVGGSASSSTRSARNVLDDRGRDAAYIRRIVDIQRELGSAAARSCSRLCFRRRGSWAPRA